MLKANVSYSKKVPVDGLDFSSQGYSLTLETEIPETNPQAIQARLHETFEMVKASVENELAKAALPQPCSATTLTPGPSPKGRGEDPNPQSSGNGFKRSAQTGGKASNKQLKFITDLATQRGISIADLNADIRRKFRVDGLYELSRKDASALLDELYGKKRAA